MQNLISSDLVASRQIQELFKRIIINDDEGEGERIKGMSEPSTSYFQFRCIRAFVSLLVVSGNLYGGGNYQLEFRDVHVRRGNGVCSVGRT